MSDGREELLKFFQMDKEDRVRLARVGELIAPILPPLLDAFYDRVRNSPELSAFFADEEQIERAKAAQRKHWEELLSGKFAESYFESAARVGRVHPKIGLPFSFFLGSYAYANSYLQEKLLKKYSGRFRSGPRDLPEMLSVMARAFGLDSHLILEAHFAADKAELACALGHLNAGIDRMERRDLSKDIPSPETSDFPQEYNHVRVSFNRAQLSMRRTVAQIRVTAESLNSGAIEVTQAAEDLAQRTESQAATLEQTAAAVEQISVSMRTAAEATQQTSSTVDSSRLKAEEGSEVVSDAVVKMNEISESSARIGKIISVIDDISFQTNLLALNAGVEAARAGESGRGFAVVASEVRALAQRTADSANEIKDLINVSRTQVEGGVDLVGRTGSMLNSIVEDIQRASKLTGEVAYSTNQQSTGFQEINIGVSQLDNVTQQNAAMVEETTAALMEMRNDAGILANVVAGFTLGDISCADDAIWGDDADGSDTNEESQDTAPQALAS